MRVLFSAVLACLLAACATPFGDTPDPFNLHIEIGRWTVMVSQVADLQEIPQREAVPDDEILDPRSLARRLRDAVWFYNLERLQLCAREHLVPVSCGPPYQPGWLQEPPSEAPSLRELARRSSAVGDRVMPFWDAVCEDARAAVADEDEKRTICPME